jgi:hypothetical protein
MPAMGDDLGGRERPAAGDLKQLGRLLASHPGDPALQVEDALARSPALGDQLGRDPRARARHLGQAPLEPIEPAGALKRPRGHIDADLQRVQVPAKAGLGPGALGHQVLAMGHEQVQIKLALGKARAGQPRMGQGGAGHGGGVDRIRLAAIPGGPARLAHQARRHPHERQPGLDQGPLQAPRDVAHVLQRHPGRLVQARDPGDQAPVPRIGGRHLQLAGHLAGGRADGDGGVALLVRIDPD